MLYKMSFVYLEEEFFKLFRWLPKWATETTDMLSVGAVYSRHQYQTSYGLFVNNWCSKKLSLRNFLEEFKKSHFFVSQKYTNLSIFYGDFLSQYSPIRLLIIILFFLVYFQLSSCVWAYHCFVCSFEIGSCFGTIFRWFFYQSSTKYPQSDLNPDR